ncbi:hypothetical protein RF11_06967 [Thelohanellus kitauei]|uniref:Uncharacterized protein n=1 Tax=Thelohanellus kitauei TaxID=669202 RepID=A0A0C2IYN9_THEKT|nr:hypothetical protein RF11_06967 [Thelohanellus kitauei]
MSYRSTQFHGIYSPSAMIRCRQFRNQLKRSISKTEGFERSSSKFMKDQLVWVCTYQQHPYWSEMNVLKAIRSNLYLEETNVGNVIRYYHQLTFRFQSQHVEEIFILEFEKPETLDLAQSSQRTLLTSLRRSARLDEKRRPHSVGAGN